MLNWKGAIGRTRGVRTLTAACGLLMLAGFASATPAPVFVFYGPAADKSDARRLTEENDVVRHMSSTYGIVGGVLASWTFGAGMAQGDRISMQSVDASSLDNYPQRLADQWGCFGLAETDNRCREVFVSTPDGLISNSLETGNSPTDGKVAAVSIKSYLLIAPTATVSFMSRNQKGKFRALDKFMVFYMVRPNELTQEQLRNPFYKNPDKPKKKELRTLTAAREAWLEGDPPLIRTTLEGFAEHVPKVLDLVYEQAATAPNDLPDLRAWYETLELIGPMAEANGATCHQDDCKNRLVKKGSHGEPFYTARYYNRDLVIRVLPCERLWCDTADASNTDERPEQVAAQ